MKRLVTVALAVVAFSIGAQAQSKSSTKAMTAQGVVKSVSASSLVVEASGGKDMTFTLDSATKFIGKGLGTKSSTGKLTATDAVHEGDQVRVSYHDMSGMLHASQVRITSKGAVAATKKK